MCMGLILKNMVPRVFRGCGEVVGGYEQQSGRPEKSHHGGAQSGEYRLYRRGMHVFEEHSADDDHQYERWQNEGRRGCETAEDGERLAKSGVVYGGISAVCGAVDAYRAGCHLADCHDVGKLARGHPTMVVHHFGLYERQHAVAAAETEKADEEEGDE